MKKNVIVICLCLMLSLLSSCTEGINIENNNKIDEKTAEIKVNEKDDFVGNIGTKDYKDVKITLNENVEYNTSCIIGDAVKADDTRKAAVNTARTTTKWVYGVMPVSWVYIEPNKALISNYKPNGSKRYSVLDVMSSGEKGCFAPVFSKTENYNDLYEGRIYIYEDSKRDPKDFTFTNALSDITYKGISVENLLSKLMQFEKLDNGLLKTSNGLINVIYIEELEKAIGEFAVG